MEYNKLEDEEYKLSTRGMSDRNKRDTVTIATYNVLYPANNKIQRYLMDHRSRFAFQLDYIIPELNSDIITLHECTMEYMNLLYQRNLPYQVSLISYLYFRYQV